MPLTNRITVQVKMDQLNDLVDKIDEAALGMERLGAVMNKDAYPIGDWKKVKRFERWWHERERKRRMSPSYVSYNPNYWYVTNSMAATTTSSAYTIQTYQVPAGTDTVKFVQWNANDYDYNEFAKQDRRPPPKEFNRYINASDLLEEFIEWLGTQGVRASDFMDLPVELFIKWLVLRACEEDHEEPNVVLELPSPSPQPRCLGCQRFMTKLTTLPLHGEKCAEMHFARQKMAA